MGEELKNIQSLIVKYEARIKLLQESDDLSDKDKEFNRLIITLWGEVIRDLKKIIKG